MKLRGAMVIVLLILSMGLYGCEINTPSNSTTDVTTTKIGNKNDSNVQDDLLKYINTSIKELEELESKKISSYDSISGDNYTDDTTMYNEMLEEVIPTTKKLIAAAEEVETETREVRELHEIYLEAINVEYSAFCTILEALEQQDFNMISDANDKLTKARKGIRDFKSEMKELAEKYDIVITEE